MKKGYICLMMLLALLGTASCSDWLDVQPETEVSENKMFEEYKGFRDALTGCYIRMVNQDLYGKRLTMTSIESLADLWERPNEEARPDDYYLYNHQYDKEEARVVIDSLYSGLYNVIVQVNILLKNLEERGNVISDNQIRSLMLGEAYALRAYCQFDILRLFGQIPQGGAKQVSLPYSETTSIYEMPSYYDFNGYVEKLMSDLDNAENYLKDNDPIFTYTFDQLNNVGTSEGIYMEDDYLAFRQFRMNYWAVRGLRARIYQYIGDTGMAYQTAKEIIDAKGADGKSLLTLSTKSDVDQGYYASPSEALFLLHAPKLIDYSIDEIGGDPSVQIRENEQLHITGTMLTQQLYAGQNTMSDVRYNQVWERNTANNGGAKYPTIKKYFYNTELNSTTIEEVYQALLTKRQVIPLMRLSEMYLIAIETTTDLAEANALYKSFMEARSVSLTEDAFASLADVKALVLDEYRREFYGEGVMFYTYKRNNTAKMLFQTGTMSDDSYILPLPNTEYDPNK